MEITKTLSITKRTEWRKWLSRNYDKEKEVWLIYYKKQTGKPSIPYDDAVEEAICFGWIDGIVKKLDEARYIQRFTPRNPKSLWSEPNIRRVKKMIKEGKMKDVGLELYKNAMTLKQVVPTIKNFKIPPDLKTELMKKANNWKSFKNFSSSDQLLYVYWVDSAKREETRKKRIKLVVERASQSLKFQ